MVNSDRRQTNLITYRRREKKKKRVPPLVLELHNHMRQCQFIFRQWALGYQQERELNGRSLPPW